jgi:archaellum biogenesis protein FlaJ (TadC family)
MATLQERLILDPGIAPARNRRTSGCKCMLLAVGALVSLLFSIGIAKIGSDLFYDLGNPHRILYQNETWSEVKNISTVVRPLVDRYQKFDIVATVWVRTIDPGDDASGLYYNWVYEDPIFSNTVFRGVRLMDKHVHTKVNLSIPLETL